MRLRALLACGMAMPFIYFLMLAASRILTPGFDLLHREPSELGLVSAAHPLVYNFGMVATGLVGLLASSGLMASSNIGRGSLWVVWAGVTLLLASLGVTMAGLFPLPNRLHYGFGLTTAAVLTPLLGAASMWRLADRLAAAVLVLGFILILGLVLGGASPLVPGALMFATIAYLCWNVRHHAGMPHSQGMSR